MASTGAAAALREQARRGDRLRESLRASTLVGTFVMEHPTAAAIRSIALAGFDFVILDLEHGAASPQEVPHLIAVAESVGLPVIIRVSDPTAGTIVRMLDLLPAGIMLPGVPDGATAVEWAAWCTHPPHGARGYAPLTAIVGAGVSTEDPRPLVVLQVETTGALRDAGVIAAIDEVDAVFVGPYDLAMALGCAVDPRDPRLRAAIAQIADDTGDSAVLGAYVNLPTDVPGWTDRGYRLLCVGFDGQIFRDGVARLRADVDAALRGSSDDPR